MKQRLVLVIAEDASIYELVNLVLEDEPDLRVVMVESAAESLRAARRVRPDLIVVDWMEWPSSYRNRSQDAVAALKGDGTIGSIPVVALTYSDDSALEVQKAGCAGFIVKPFDVVSFVSQIRRFLPLLQREAS